MSPFCALVWITLRQLAVPTLILSAFALVFGLSFLVPGVVLVFYWPMLALTAGVIAGVLTFSTEQARGEYRFWAESRLPLRGLWSVKVGVHLLLLTWVLAVLAFPCVVRSQLLLQANVNRPHTFLGAVFNTRLFDELGSTAWLFLLVPAIYGFVAGHLCGLLFRKAVVAAGVAGLLGGTAALIWVPSMLAGGLNSWQVLAPAAVWLLVGTALIRPWTTERLRHRRAVGSVVLGSGLAVTLLVIGLAYRVYEVPEGMDFEADVAFVESLPPLLERTAGREFQGAVASFQQAQERISGVVTSEGVPRELRPKKVRASASRVADLEQVLLHGWQDDDAPSKTSVPMAQWLDELMLIDEEGPHPHWSVEAQQAVHLPTGTYADPRLGMSPRIVQTMEQAREMSLVLLVRGLQEQAAGNHASLPDRLAVALALARCLRNGSSVMGFEISLILERAAALATCRWLERCDRSPELLRRVLDLWLEMDAAKLTAPSSCYLAERYILRERETVPSIWLTDVLQFQSGDHGTIDPVVNLVSVAWSVPWERERTRRLVEVPFDVNRGPLWALLRDRPGASLFSPKRMDVKSLTEINTRRQAARRMLILKLALLLYEAKTGRKACSLEELIASGILREIPKDPYDSGQPLQYRVSPGETLLLYSSLNRVNSLEPGDESAPTFEVPAGRCIVWSVGPSGINAPGRWVMSPSDPTHFNDDDLLHILPRFAIP